MRDHAKQPLTAHEIDQNGVEDRIQDGVSFQRVSTRRGDVALIRGWEGGVENELPNEVWAAKAGTKEQRKRIRGGQRIVLLPDLGIVAVGARQTM